MTDTSYFRLQLIVFALVSASFTNIYITQPVLPILQTEFAADMVLVSFSVSAVILGIALFNLPFGFLADRLPIHPIILIGAALTLLLLPSIMAVVLGLLGICAGFFSIHAAAVGALNRMLSSGQGKANALYVMFYYMGGWFGITVCGIAYKHGGWRAVVFICLSLLIIPVSTGIGERKIIRNSTCD